MLKVMLCYGGICSWVVPTTKVSGRLEGEFDTIICDVFTISIKNTEKSLLIFIEYLFKNIVLTLLYRQ